MSAATKHLHTRKRFRFKCLAEYVFSIVHMENAGLLEEEEEEERGGGGYFAKFSSWLSKEYEIVCKYGGHKP